LGVVPYAFSLDWLAWGLGHLGWLGAWRAGVSLLFLLLAVIAIRLSGTTLLPLTIANAASAALGAALLWAVWRLRWRPPQTAATAGNDELASHLGWAAVLPLGASTILNLMFNNFDTVMLAGMTTAREVGRYNAAYKILFLIFGAYYLVTQSLYPKLSRLKGGSHPRKMLFVSLAALAAFGACMSVAIAANSSLILRAIYGREFGAVHLLRVLCLAVPMEFCVALLGTVLVSRGFHNLVLICTGSAAAFNVASNWFLIPRMGAEGAAWSTVTSYLFLLILVLAVFTTKPVLQEEPSARVGSECAA
jgi:O-antigen/teichoic acid export membrane protein